MMKWQMLVTLTTSILTQACNGHSSLCLMLALDDKGGHCEDYNTEGPRQCVCMSAVGHFRWIVRSYGEYGAGMETNVNRARSVFYGQYRGFDGTS